MWCVKYVDMWCGLLKRTLIKTRLSMNQYVEMLSWGALRGQKGSENIFISAVHWLVLVIFEPKKKKRKWTLQLTAVIIRALDVCLFNFTFVSLAILPRVIWNIPTSTGSGCWRYVAYINARQRDFDFGVLFKALLAVADLGQGCKGYSKLRLLIQ